MTYLEHSVRYSCTVLVSECPNRCSQMHSRVASTQSLNLDPMELQGSATVMPNKSQMTFLTISFPLHPTTMVHSMRVGVSGQPTYFQPTMWELGACPGGRYIRVVLFAPESRFIPLKRGSSLQSPSHYDHVRPSMDEIDIF